MYNPQAILNGVSVDGTDGPEIDVWAIRPHGSAEDYRPGIWVSIEGRGKNLSFLIPMSDALSLLQKVAEFTEEDFKPVEKWTTDDEGVDAEDYDWGF